MITIENALSQMSKYCKDCSGCIGDDCDYCWYPKAFEALKKQIPQSATTEKFVDKSNFVFVSPKCPNCGISFISKRNYCDNCGQALSFE